MTNQQRMGEETGQHLYLLRVVRFISEMAEYYSENIRLKPVDDDT